MRLKSLLLSLGVVLLVAGCGSSPETLIPEESPYWAEQDRLISLDGTTIRLRESGPETGHTLILLHGFTDSLQTWEPLVAELDDTFRILRPDLPGHGLSGPVPGGDYSNAALVKFVQSLIADTGAETPIIVGNSLGGLAAWRTAAIDPESLSGLVLLAPGGVPHNGVDETPAEVPAMLRFYLSNAPEAGVRTALKAMHANADNVTDARVTEYKDLMKGQGAAFIARAEQFTLPDPTDDMAKITVPTTVLWGAEDTVLPPNHATVFEENIPNAKVIVLDGVGHLPQAEATAQVAEIIRNMAIEIETVE